MTVKPNILVVHGALGSAAQMEPVARALESLGTVDNIQLLGHGTSIAARPADFSMPAFMLLLQQRATHARQSSTESNGGAPLILGYSMGGYAALSLEAQHPGTFSGIVTLGTKFAWTPALALRECSRLDAKTIAEKVPKFAAVLQERHASAGGWELLLERTSALLAELGDKPLLTRETLSRVQAAVCIAVGEKDDTVSADESIEYASYIPRATCEVLPETPHPIERVSVEDIVALVLTVFRASRR